MIDRKKGTPMTRRAQIQRAASTVAAKRGNVPVLRAILGVLLVAFLLLALLLQVQTSEAFLLGGSPVTLAANWGVLSQPVLLAEGLLPLDLARAVMWGWGIELVYLACVIGEVSVHGRLRCYFQTGALAFVAFNFWTDLNYGTLASGLWGQIALAGRPAFIWAFLV